jgi:murein L,D-transpeptidase YafK
VLGLSGSWMSPFAGKGSRYGLAVAALLGLAACDENGRLPSNSRHYVPISPQMEALMSEKGMNARSPILMRAYKKESELELWKQDASGEYKLLKTFPMCRWSGQLGPKKTEGDRQVPEGFYAITPQQLNPNSSFYLSFNVGYPNTYDRAFSRTGSHIMVHGACSSRGCFSMTDEQIAEIYALTREAFGGGQKAVQLQSFPFRFTPQNLARYRADEHMPFWKNLKEGADHFDVTKREPQVAVCGRRYVFNAQPKDGARFDAQAACPPIQQDDALVAAVTSKARGDDQQVASLVSAGTKAVKRIYQDGDQHPSFKHTIHAQIAAGEGNRLAAPAPAGTSRVAEVSQPDALDHGPVDVPAEQARGLSRQALLAKASQVRLQESGVLATPRPAAAPAANARAVAAAPAPVNAAPAPANAAVVAPPRSTATALVSSEPTKKQEPAFYQRWIGSLGNLTANAAGTGEEALRPVTAPLPPQAPPRR